MNLMSPRKPKTDLLKQYLQFGLGLMLTTSFAVLKIPKLYELVQTNLVEGILSISLFVVTCGWLGGWIYFDHQEIQYVEEYYDTKSVKIKTEPFLSALFIGLFSGLLFGLTDQPRFYILAAMGNWVLGMFGYKTVRKTLHAAFGKDERYQQGVRKIINDYYLKSPFYWLDTIALIVIAVGLGLAWYSFFAQKPFFHYLSYGIAIVTVLVHEGILWIWRIRRDRKIEEIEDLEDGSEEQ